MLAVSWPSMGVSATTARAGHESRHVYHGRLCRLSSGLCLDGEVMEGVGAMLWVTGIVLLGSFLAWMVCRWP